MRVFTYVIEHDKGFAPNPFFSVCSLAACKPAIRKAAQVGDLILGFGSAKHRLAGKLIYWMKVDEIVTFDEYWNDKRFAAKRPQLGGSMMVCYGDNLYHKDPVTKAWIQEPSFHTDAPDLKGGSNIERDTGKTERVLLGREFAYWGADAIALPAELGKFRAFGRAGRSWFPDEERQNMWRWLQAVNDRGFRGEPADWRTDRNLKNTKKKAN